jgi:Fe-S cluster biogenesis protein NfuA
MKAPKSGICAEIICEVSALVKPSIRGYIRRDMAKTPQEFREDVERVLETLRGGLAMHAGGVDLVDANLETGLVSVRLLGTCVGCPMSDLTLKAGIEETLRELVPEVKEVVAVPPTVA